MNNEYFLTRLIQDNKRIVLWKTLCNFVFNKMISPEDTVLELGAGYGDFINNIRAKKKYAIDIWEGSKEYLNKDVVFFCGSIRDLSILEKNSIDFVFASNLLEHLKIEDIKIFLEQIKPCLKDNATINIIQPNFKYCFREYFDDYTHITIFTEKSLKDLLESHGFKVFYMKPKYLPFTVKSKLPVFPFLIKLYLILPIKPIGKQMFLRAIYSR